MSDRRSLSDAELRDWFAGQALVGIISNPNNKRTVTIQTMADDAYDFADAMLAARKDNPDEH